MHRSAVAEPVTGRQVYRWVLGRAFLQQDWIYDHPDFPNAIAMLDEHREYYFDVRGIVVEDRGEHVGTSGTQRPDQRRARARATFETGPLWQDVFHDEEH